HNLSLRHKVPIPQSKRCNLSSCETLANRSALWLVRFASGDPGRPREKSVFPYPTWVLMADHKYWLQKNQRVQLPDYRQYTERQLQWARQNPQWRECRKACVA